MRKILVCTVIGTLVAGVLRPVAAASSDETDVSQEIVLKLQEAIKDNWKKLSTWSGKVTELRAEFDTLPNSVWIGSDKKSCRKVIHKKRRMA